MKTNKKKTATTPPFKKIVIKSNYKDFNHFYDTNKNLIYKSIVDLFKEFKKTRKRSLCLYVTAKIQDLVWDTEFNFKKEQCFILKRDVMPYFECIEDYETCDEILKLHDELTCSK